MSTTTETTSQKQTIHELQHAAQRYRIITSDEDIFERTGEQIVRACQLQMSVSAWRQNFALMIEHVGNWCKERSGRVALALVELRSDKAVFYIIPSSEQFDFALGLEQADLDIFLNTRGAIGYVETRQVPAWEIERFVAPEAYRVWPLD